MLTRLKAAAMLLFALAFLLALTMAGCSRNASKPVQGLTSSTSTSSELTSDTASVLAELDALQCPADAKPENFARVKARMREILLQKAGSKGINRASDSPYDPYGIFWNNQMNLIWEDDGTDRGRLTWEYKNLGDYNQDGIVGVSDCTPIAVHFECPITDCCL